MAGMAKIMLQGQRIPDWRKSVQARSFHIGRGSLPMTAQAETERKSADVFPIQRDSDPGRFVFLSQKSFEVCIVNFGDEPLQQPGNPAWSTSEYSSLWVRCWCHRPRYRRETTAPADNILLPMVSYSRVPAGRLCNRPTMAVTIPLFWIKSICRWKMEGVSLSNPMIKPPWT